MENLHNYIILVHTPAYSACVYSPRFESGFWMNGCWLLFWPGLMLAVDCAECRICALRSAVVACCFLNVELEKSASCEPDAICEYA
jgi:hypothetical protein